MVPLVALLINRNEIWCHPWRMPISCTETGLCKYLASLDLLRFGFEELNMPGTVIVIIFSRQLLRVMGKEKQGLPHTEKPVCGTPVS